MIDLEKEQLEKIKLILQNHIPGYEVRVFGSRISGKAEKYADLDLVIMVENQPGSELITQLKDAFALSDLPFMVDVSQWSSLPDFLKEQIKSNSVVMQNSR